MPERDADATAETLATVEAARNVDVLDISDLRFPGGTSHSIAEEISAQFQAGYSSGLLNLNTPLVFKVTPINPVLRRVIEAGKARLLIGQRPIRARVVIVRHPAVLQHAADQLPPIETDNVVIVANAGPYDIDGHEHYRPETVHQVARQYFGREPLWAPIGPLIRSAIDDKVPADTVATTDWVNIIDVDHWAQARSTPRDRDHQRLVIGRHSRSSPQKWPADAATLRAVYPVDGSYTVRVLGGAEPAAQLLGELPSSWDVLPFGAMSPREFLASLDFFVYFHHPRWVEAFGRTILEAMASGVPVILPGHFRDLFGDAAVYVEPADVPSALVELAHDPDGYEAQVARAHRFVQTHFGHEVHTARIERLIGPPRGAPAPPAPLPTLPSRAPRVLFISSNGAGMGHLTRLLAYARHCASNVESHFLSLSQAVPIVAQFGYPYEYLASAIASGLAPQRWHSYFATAVSATIQRIRPSVVVFDGTWPYEGIRRVRAEHPDVLWVWSRRGMWRAGKNRGQLEKSAWFDLIIEPGELAQAGDRGATAHAKAHRVGPVTLLDVAELDSRADARAALGLNTEAPMALVSLGAGNINDTRADVGAVVASLRELGVDVCVTEPQIAARAGVPDDVHVVRDYPLSRRYRAFDLAVSAAGYNSFHELLRFGVPTLFVPNRATALDDQEGRARFAARQGWAYLLDVVTVDRATSQLAALLDDGPQMAAKALTADPGNGAIEAAEEIGKKLSEKTP
jgi:UDP:flavonoid glycosyltransferase YjiC (YdhE family)/glycosyltransferase involved in cell wall biosynthesis